MLWTSITLLGLSLVIWRCICDHPNDAIRFLAILSAVSCLTVGIAVAPILVQSLILLALLTFPSISRSYVKTIYSRRLR
ncbi:MAG: hypothetical protein SWY16_20055 [Cyanobacteriota bacterium]|nr:hypothetical protein [Cyanobacteriota bacterium]